jgi:acetyltransferase-like isoleucine patch superfamily enzyme
MKPTKQKLIHVLRKPVSIFTWLITRLPYFKFIKHSQEANDKINFGIWFRQKVIGFNKAAYWPVHFTSKIVGAQNIYVGIGTNPGFNPGIYIQGTGKLYFGNYTTIGQNTGIMSGSHDIYDHSILTKGETKIGDYCWIGMNCTILPNVILGDCTVVAAGSVVTKSFEEGYAIIGGTPAKIIRNLDPEKFIKFSYQNKYHGYIKQSKFERFRKAKLEI